MSVRELKDLSNKSFDPNVDEDLAFGSTLDPYPIIAEQRAKARVARGQYRSFFGAEADTSFGDIPHYTIWRHEDVDFVLSDPELFSSAIAHRINVEPAFGRILVVMDPPDHTRYRRFLHSIFSPRQVKSWTDTIIKPMIQELIDEFAGKNAADLVSQFTQRYPFDAVYRLLDLPASDIALFQKLAVTQTFAITPYWVEAKEAGRNLAEYLEGLAAERRAKPGSDLISQLVQIEIDGAKLEDEIVVAFLRHILNASADTSYRTTGVLLYAMLSDPALLAELTADRSLIPLAIEEALRWDGPVTTNFRTLTRDLELGGVLMEAGSVIHAVHGSANRDERHFENSNRFDIHRSRKSRHMGFGGGPHLCLGVHLARAQIREAVTALLDRLPGLRLDPAAPAPEIRGFMFRKPPALNVVFD